MRRLGSASRSLASLRLSAVQAVVAMAVASGSTGIDACVVLGESEELAGDDTAVLGEFAGGSGVLVHLGDPRGRIASSATL